MTWLATVFQLLALLAILVTHPISQWFCTVEQTFCSSPYLAATTAHSDCCGETSCENGKPETPCCVEISTEWQIVPGTASSSLPPLPPCDQEPNFGPDTLAAAMLAPLEPRHRESRVGPLSGVPLRTVFCVRLI